MIWIEHLVAEYVCVALPLAIGTIWLWKVSLSKRTLWIRIPARACSLPMGLLFIFLFVIVVGILRTRHAVATSYSPDHKRLAVLRSQWRGQGEMLSGYVYSYGGLKEEPIEWAVCWNAGTPSVAWNANNQLVVTLHAGDVKEQNCRNSKEVQVTCVR